MKADPRDRNRSHLALSRLFPLLRPTRPSTTDGVEEHYYARTPGQNHLEIWVSSGLFNLTWILFLCGAIWHLGPIPPAVWPVIVILCTVAIPFLILLIMGIAEPLARSISRRFEGIEPALVHSVFQQTILFAVAIEASFDSHWVRWVGQVWIALVAVELAARLIERFVLRRERETSAS